MNELKIFENNDFKIRTLNEDDEFWFVAKDVVEALEYSYWQPNIVSNVPEIWKGIKRINTPGGEQEMLCLTEQGLYFFLGRSDKQKALPYQMWIAGDVIPSIRKTGSYTLRNSQAALPSGVLEGAKLIFEVAGIKDNQLSLAMDRVYKSYTGRSALQIGEIELQAPTKRKILAPKEIGRELGISAQKVNQILAGEGYQYKLSNGEWEPLELGMPYAVMLDVNKAHAYGTTRQLK